MRTGGEEKDENDEVRAGGGTEGVRTGGEEK